MTPEQRKEAIVALVDTLLDMVATPDDEDTTAMEGSILGIHLADMDVQALATCAAVGTALIAGAHGEHERRGMTGG